jgi:hypothetical protein
VASMLTTKEVLFNCTNNTYIYSGVVIRCIYFSYVILSFWPWNIRTCMSNCVLIGWVLFNCVLIGWVLFNCVLIGWVLFNCILIGWVLFNCVSIGWVLFNCVLIGWVLKCPKVWLLLTSYYLLGSEANGIIHVKSTSMNVQIWGTLCYPVLKESLVFD